MLFLRRYEGISFLRNSRSSGGGSGRGETGKCTIDPCSRASHRSIGFRDSELPVTVRSSALILPHQRNRSAKTPDQAFARKVRDIPPPCGEFCAKTAEFRGFCAEIDGYASCTSRLVVKDQMPTVDANP